MSSKFERYLNESLAGCGFAVLDHEAAFRLRGRELWQTSTEAWVDSGGVAVLEQLADAMGQRLLKFMAEAVDADGRKRVVPVVARSGDMLDRRIEWVVGYQSVKLKAVARFVEPQPAAPKPAPIADEPPPQPCNARDQWFDEHPGQVDPLKAYEKRKRFGAPRR